MPGVSVVLTSYERPRYLDEAIQSIRTQEFDEFELLVCDDNSGPNVARVVERHAKEDRRVVLLPSEIRMGVAANVKRGLLAAQAPLVAICNDDDAWEPAFLARMVEALAAHPDAVLAFSDHHIMNERSVVDPAATEENTRRWKRDVLAAGLHRPFTRLAVIDQAIPMVMATVFRREAVAPAEIPADVGGVYDLWMAYLAARGGLGACYVPERLTRYRVHAQSTTSASDATLARASVAAWRRMLEDDRLAELGSDLQVKLHIALTGLGARSLDEAHQAFVEAARLRPTLRAVAGAALTAGAALRRFT